MNLAYQNETVPSLLETIINNLCLQIIAFQQSINERMAGTNFPTADETNQLVKLVNVLNKLHKQQLADAFEKRIKSFTRFLKNSDPELANTVTELFHEFMGGSAQPEPTRQPTPSLPELPMPEQKLPIPTVIETAPAASIPNITRDEFETYRHLLQRQPLGLDASATTQFRGREVNTNWLQYNLYQVFQPSANRNFFMQEHDYHNRFNHTEVRQTMIKYLEKHELIR